MVADPWLGARERMTPEQRARWDAAIAQAMGTPAAGVPAMMGVTPGIDWYSQVGIPAWELMAQYGLGQQQLGVDWLTTLLENMLGRQGLGLQAYTSAAAQEAQRQQAGQALMNQLVEMQRDPFNIVTALQAYGATPSATPLASDIAATGGLGRPSPYGPVVDQLISGLAAYSQRGMPGAADIWAYSPEESPLATAGTVPGAPGTSSLRDNIMNALGGGMPGVPGVAGTSPLGGTTDSAHPQATSAQLGGFAQILGALPAGTVIPSTPEGIVADGTRFVATGGRTAGELADLYKRTASARTKTEQARRSLQAQGIDPTRLRAGVTPTRMVELVNQAAGRFTPKQQAQIAAADNPTAKAAAMRHGAQAAVNIATKGLSERSKRALSKVTPEKMARIKNLAATLALGK